MATFGGGGGAGGGINIVGDDGQGWGEAPPPGAGPGPQGPPPPPAPAPAPAQPGGKHGAFAAPPPPPQGGFGAPPQGGFGAPPQGGFAGAPPQGGFPGAPLQGHPGFGAAPVVPPQQQRPGPGDPFAGAGYRCPARRITSKGRKKNCVLAVARRTITVCSQKGEVQRLIPCDAVGEIKRSQGGAKCELVLCVTDAPPGSPDAAEPDLVFELPSPQEVQRVVEEVQAMRLKCTGRPARDLPVPHPASRQADHRKGQRKQRAPLEQRLAVLREQAANSPGRSVPPPSLPPPEGPWEGEPPGDLQPTLPPAAPAALRQEPPPAAPKAPEEEEEPDSAPQPFRLRHKETGAFVEADADGGLCLREGGEGDRFAADAEGGMTHVPTGKFLTGEPLDGETDDDGEPLIVLKLEDEGGPVWVLGEDGLLCETGEGLAVTPFEAGGEDEAAPLPLILKPQSALEGAAEAAAFEKVHDPPPPKPPRRSPPPPRAAAPPPRAPSPAVDRADELDSETSPEPAPASPASPPKPVEPAPDDPRRLRWLAEGFHSFYSKYDREKLSTPGAAHAAARATATFGGDMAYRRLLQRYPDCPVEDLEWVRHPPPIGLRDSTAALACVDDTDCSNADALLPLHRDVLSLQKEIRQLTTVLGRELARPRRPPRPAARSPSPPRPSRRTPPGLSPAPPRLLSPEQADPPQPRQLRPSPGGPSPAAAGVLSPPPHSEGTVGAAASPRRSPPRLSRSTSPPLASSAAQAPTPDCSASPRHHPAPGVDPAAVYRVQEEQLGLLRRLVHLQRVQADDRSRAEREGAYAGELRALQEQLRVLRQIAAVAAPLRSSAAGAGSRMSPQPPARRQRHPADPASPLWYRGPPAPRGLQVAR